jgi:ubiquinone/menaquinone biosynthesis C-methylase UbiE
MKGDKVVKQTFEAYLNSVNLQQLFKRLGATNPATLMKTVEHFTVKEAEKRDKIVLVYFGEVGVQRIVEAVTEQVKPLELRKGSKVLDVGAGSGSFTARIAQCLPQAKFYAMDATPAMLQALAKKTPGITTFLGIAENIQASITEAKAYADIPAKFDAAFSTLMLHHSAEPATVFKSIKNVLKKNGKAIILDMCEHTFTEFKTEMQDIHLGFNLGDLQKTAKKHFTNVTIAKMPGISCSSSGRLAKLFTATLSTA